MPESPSPKEPRTPSATRRAPTPPAEPASAPAPPRLWQRLDAARENLAMRLQPLWARARERGLDGVLARLRTLLRSPILWFSALALAVTIAYVRHEPRPFFTASPYAHGDGTYFYAYERSLLFDRDVDFANDYALLGNQFAIGTVGRTGRAGNVATIGPAIVWAPFAALARVAVPASNALGWSHETVNGAGPLFQRITLFGSVVAGLAALLLTFLLARRAVGDQVAFAAALAMGLGTPLLWYMIRQASFSHAVSAGTAALFVFTWSRTQERRTPLGWFGLGALLGLAMLVRPQDVGHGLLPLADFVLLALALRRAPGARRDALLRLLRVGGLFLAGALVAFAPQMIVWKVNYGHWLTMPQGAGFLLWGASRWGETLFSSRAGLFAWHLAFPLGFIGLVLASLSRHVPWHLVRFARLGLLVFAFQAFINGAALDWWAGWAFGGRRFLSSTIYFGVGLAILFAAVVRWLETGWQRLVRWVPLAVTALLLIFNLSLMEDYYEYRAKHGEPQEMKPLWRAAIGGAVDKVYAVTGNWGSAPSNWIFALRAGVSPERYDLASSNELFPSGPTAVAPFVDARHAMGGFGEPAAHLGRACRWVEGEEAVWVFALRTGGDDLEATVRLAAAVPGTRVRLRASGAQVLDANVGAAWSEHKFRIPARLTGAGLNYVEVEQQVPGPAARPPAPRGVAWDSVTFTRVPPARPQKP